MRKRFQNGRVVKSSEGRYWVGKWLEGGRDRSKVLGKVAMMTKTKAREEVARIVKPINERAAVEVSQNVTVKDFVEKVYLPFYRLKWKRSTAMTNEDRVKHHIVEAFGERELRALNARRVAAFSRIEGQSVVQHDGSLAVGKVVADQQGHTLDVNLNVYTETSLESRIEAVETLGSALIN
jgi:hypothetical protein